MDFDTMAEQSNLILTAVLDIQKEQGNLKATISGIDVKVDGISVQTNATNGRVTKHDGQLAELQSLRDQLSGGWKTLLLVGAISTTLGSVLGFLIHTAIAVLR